MVTTEIISPPWEKDLAILNWSARIDQTVANDAPYLALAEELQSELWTADRRLAETAQKAGAGWVQTIR